VVYLREHSPLVSFDSSCFVSRLGTAVLERIPALLSSDDFGSSVEREAHGQVLWRVRVKVAGERWKLRTAVGLVRAGELLSKSGSLEVLHVTQV
jgi:hypothetical protein